MTDDGPSHSFPLPAIPATGLPAADWPSEADVMAERHAWYRKRRRRQLRLSVLLFLATLVTTTLVGSGFAPLALFPGLLDEQIADALVREHRLWFIENGRPLSFQEGYLKFLWQGFTYSGPLMLILLCHELGHFLQAVRYRVPATYPFFIPLPLPPFGTMGAVIAQGRGVADRRQMFDIAVTGPLAGLAVTLPVLYLGIRSSYIDVILPHGVQEFGEPLLIQWMIAWIHGPVADGQMLYMNGPAMAGWVGVFITALNLLPVGQLDGGHLTYTMLGKAAHWLAMGLIVAGLAAMYLTGSFSYVLMLLLVMMTGVRHPPTRDDTVPLGTTRHIIGWLTLSFLVIGFTPTPIILH